MAKPAQTSLKRLKLDKTNGRIVAITAIAAFLIVFFLVASVSMFKQMTYQNRVIGVKKDAVAQLKQNLEDRDSLVQSYQAFVTRPQNILSGNPEGNGPQDGSNAKLVLDALPSKYDFPALTSSLEKLLLERKVKINSINGTDDEIAQSATTSEGDPAPVEMPVEITAEGTYFDIQQVILALQQSIRPFKVTSLEVNGDDQDLTLKAALTTYYQPEKTLNIKLETVK